MRISISGYETTNMMKEVVQNVDAKNINNDKDISRDYDNSQNYNKYPTNVDEVEEDLGLEYRLNSSILPLRCYLDSHFIHFLLELNKNQTNIQNEKLKLKKDKDNDSENKNKNKMNIKVNGGEEENHTKRENSGQFPYFQYVWIAPIHLKINYEPGPYIRSSYFFYIIVIDDDCSELIV